MKDLASNDLSALVPTPLSTHPLVGRQRYLVVFLRVSAVIAMVFAVGGVLLPAPANKVASYGMVTVLILVPIARVGWLFVRWLRRGDKRFALVAGALLLVIGVGGVAAIL